MPSRIPVVTGWILAGLMLAVQDLAGQPGCQETLQAVPDTTICHPGGTVQLNGLFSGDAQNILEVEWTPAAGLSDPFVLDPLATVNATTTYTLRVRHFTGNNLFANGDFESGNTGFTSDYNHSPANLVPEGVYAITANPSIQHPGFAPCGDHTSGGGNMMAVNGAGTPGLNVWCQTVSVLPNTTYIFSAWVTSLHPSFPAILQFYANGASMGAEFEAPPTTCDWQQYYNLWYSGNATSATFCIVNQNTILGGNDFAMDDIYLSEVCEYEDEVTITVLDQIVEYQSHFLCAGESVEVGGQTFQSSGSYTVVLPSFQGCDSTIVVDVEVLDVEAWILPPEALSCQQNEVTLDGSLSTGSYGVATYQWSTSGGMIISNPQMPSVTVGAAGTYQLLVSTQGPGITCWDSTAVTVVLDTATIGISVLPPEALSCQDSVTTLTAVAPLMPPGAPVEWITPDGLILAGLNTLTPLVQGTGTYTVILTNPLNGCTSEAFAVLTGDTLRPVLAHDPVGAITCRDSAVVLVTRVLSPDSGTIAAWTTPDGLLLAGADSLAPLVGRTGTYTLTVTDTLRGCTASLVLTVGIDTLHPVLSLAAADTLGCREDSLSVLLGIWPDSLPWSVGWTTPDGLLLAGAATPNPVFGAPGTYTASVQNPLNGCRDSASVTVIRHEEPPLALAGPDLVLDCLADSLQPQSLASDQGPGITYRWWFNGNPVDTLLQPWLSQPGSWVLHVTNNQNRCEAFDTLALTDIRAWPDPVIAPPLRLTCTLTAVALDASASDSGHHVLQWTGPQGGIASGASSPSPQITLPGWYVLTLTDTLNHCAGTDSVLVDQDIAPPDPSIAPPDSLDCNHPQVTLQAAATSASGQVTWAWTTSGGNLVSGEDTPTPAVNAGGWYVLTLTDPVNGCTARDSVWVFQDPDLPVVSIPPPDTLTCTLTQVLLQATIQAPGTQNVLVWSTADGIILAGGQTAVATIGAPGTYVFTLTDLATGCTTSDEVTVTADIAPPPGHIDPPMPLSCIDTLRTLEVTSPLAVSVQWSTTGGTIVSDPAAAAVQVSAPGAYRAVWTHPATGCRDSLTVMLTEDRIPPVARAGQDDRLPCVPPAYDLDGSASAGQGALAFHWSALTGQLTGSVDAAQATATAPGTFRLEVTDSANGCRHADTVVLVQDIPDGALTTLTPPGCRRAEGEVLLLGATGGTPPYAFLIDSMMHPGGASLLLPPGTWSLTVIDALGCRYDSALVMPDRQDLVLTSPDEVWVVYGDSGRIELTTNFPATAIDTVIWDPLLWLTPTADPLVWFSHATLALQHRVRVRTADGCEASALIQVLIDHDPRIYVPNVFSPADGNGINDRFFPYTKPGSVQEIRHMAIYDRWGNQVFSAAHFPPDDAAYGWDGRHQGRLMNPAVFVWVIEAVMDNGEIAVLKGDVTLH